MIDDEIADREANVFAMELLMPESMVRERVKLPLNESQVEALAKEFQVDVIRMTIRLVDLGYIKRNTSRAAP